MERMSRFPSLVAKLALFYGALGLLALVVVKSTVLWLEFRELSQDLERGSLERVVAEVALELGSSWAPEAEVPGFSLDHAIETIQVRLERSGAGEGGDVLGEVESQPLSARIVDAKGTTLAVGPSTGRWLVDVPERGAVFWENFTTMRGVQLVARAEPPALRRIYATPLSDQSGKPRGALLVELRLSLPWKRVLLSSSLEWPILLTYLTVFGLGSALFLSRYVTSRLRRIGAAASAWSQGDFVLIEEGPYDEIGRLAHRLNRMALDLRALVATRARLATLEERQRLARDLHDTVKQKAFALNLQLATATRLLGHTAPAARTKIDEARRITEEIQVELVQILDELRAAERAAALGPTLETKVADFARRSGIAAESELPAAPSVPPAHHEAIARIVDEALANVLRHSGAKRVRVGLEVDDDGFRLEVADDGRGLGGEPGSGMGIHNMRARATSLPGGRLDIHGGDGGTRVTVCWREESLSNDLPVTTP